MTPFERDLQAALARKEPSHGFADRVLNAVEGQSKRRMSERRWFAKAWAWRLAPLVAALLLVTGGALYHEHVRAVRGEAAKQELLTAVRIAGSKLHDARQHVIEIEGTEVDR
jgi:hypothetical protein